MQYMEYLEEGVYGMVDEVYGMVDGVYEMVDWWMGYMSFFLSENVM